MSEVDEALREIETLNNARDHDAEDSEYDRQWDELEAKVEETVTNHDLDGLSQDQMVKFLDLTRNMSWDIPSALGALCSHLDIDEYYFMHRPAWKWNEETKHHEDDEDLWVPADTHFKEVHDWDMSDKRIDWGFDT